MIFAKKWKIRDDFLDNPQIIDPSIVNRIPKKNGKTTVLLYNGISVSLVFPSRNNNSFTL
jgi:hypothetical protein